MEDPAARAAAATRLKAYFVLLAFVLLALTIFFLVYLATTPVTALTAMLSFAGGVSNIVLPCTLPLVFIIVPLCMGKGYRKGLAMALLFSLGLILMLSAYGAGVALAGRFLGLDDMTRLLYVIAGVAALLFGLSELRLIRFTLPSYLGTPAFIQKQPDYFKSFFMGLFLGNAGVGCPNPVTYLILTAAAGSGSVATGALYMAVNGLGRALPLLFMAVLAILGVNATAKLVQHRQTVDRITGWTLVVVSLFITLNGVFGHLWYEGSLFHEGLNRFFAALGGERLAEWEGELPEKPVPFSGLGPWLYLLFPPAVLTWYYVGRKGEMSRRTFAVLLLVFLGIGLLFLPVFRTME